MENGRMYPSAKTWNPHKGCLFDCTYCAPTFQRQAKRQKNLCMDCYHYRPHIHPDRLDKIPSAEIVFVGGNGDISFCPPAFFWRILRKIHDHNRRCPHKTYYLQTKRPEYLGQFVDGFPLNAICVTTLETNRDEGYGRVSKAPKPTERHRQFLELPWDRKVVTIEPVLDFDLEPFARMIEALHPEYVWVGFNSHPTEVPLPEPTEEKVKALIEILKSKGIEVRGKDLRNAA